MGQVFCLSVVEHTKIIFSILLIRNKIYGTAAVDSCPHIFPDPGGIFPVLACFRIVRLDIRIVLAFVPLAAGHALTLPGIIEKQFTGLRILSQVMYCIEIMIEKPCRITTLNRHFIYRAAVQSVRCKIDRF